MDDRVRSAATVLVLRDTAGAPEVFMVRRHDRTAFMGGAHVFPGGAVDAADREAAEPGAVDGLAHAGHQLPQLDPIEAAAHHVAAIRELFEEAGVLLARDRAGQLVDLTDRVVHERFARHRLDVHAGVRTFRSVLADERLRAAADTLVLFAHWVTPPMTDTKRFDTRFFAVRMPPRQWPVHDEHETTDGRWMTALDAIGAAERHEIILPPPTWITLRELADFSSVSEILGWAAARDVRRREAARVESQGATVLLLPHPDRADRWGSGETPFTWMGDRWLPRLS